VKKKQEVIEPVNTALLRRVKSDDLVVGIQKVDAAEADEMWSFVGTKKAPRWLWHAIDHCTGTVLASVFGRRKDKVFGEVKRLLKPFGITRYYTDHWGAYARHLAPEEHCPGKRNTQTSERKHLTLRTRIKRLGRKTICFSKSIQMHDIVIGLFVNRYEFGLPV
jgi:insertion element IS1 protein InsB